MGVKILNNRIEDLLNDGKFWTVNYAEKIIADESSIYLRFKCDANTKAYLLIEVQSEGKAEFKTYKGTTYVDNGTPPDGVKLTKFNRKTGEVGISGVELDYAPTINNIGELRGNQIILGGVGPQSTGTSSGITVESVICPTHEFLIELKNVSGQAKDMTIILDWHEEVM